METDNMQITCEQCKTKFDLTLIDDFRLQGMGLVIREIHGICSNCGYGFHWCVTDQRLRKLIHDVDERAHNAIR